MGSRSTLARWWRRAGRRLCDTYFNPEYWHSCARTAIYSWASQKVVVCWCLLEWVVSGMLTVPFLLMPPIDKLDETWLKSDDAMVGILVLRASSGLLGAFASFFRKVTRTKFYFGAMLMNIVLSVLVAEALASCTCVCRAPYSNPQCDVVLSFKSWLEFLNIVGGVDNELIAGPPASPLVPGRGELVRSLAAPLTPGRDEVAENPATAPLTPDETKELMAVYNVTEVGIMWTWTDTLGCRTVTGGDTNMLRELAFLLTCNVSAFAKRLGELGAFRDSLDVCATEAECSLVSLVVAPGPPQHREASSQSTSEYTVCRYAGPITPYVSSGESAGDPKECLCKERCPPSELLRAESCDACSAIRAFATLRDGSRRGRGWDAAEMQVASFTCHWTIRGTLYLLLMLDFLACLMILVVSEFLHNRCGDPFIAEDQFELRRSRASTAFTDAWDDGESFAVDWTATGAPNIPEVEMRAM